jgi:hypothetical protein
MALGGRINSPHVATSVADESVDSDAYVDGSIDTAHLAADAVDGTRIADDAVDSEHYTDASIDTAHIANLQITTGLIAADAVTSAKIADDAIDSEHYTDNSVDAAHLFDLARGSLLIGNGSAATAELTVGSDNYVLTVDGSGDIGWEAAAAGGISTTLADGNILVGNGSNVATSVNPSGDVDIATDGTFSIASGAVVDADVNGSAAISISKTALVAGTNITLSTNTLAVDDAFIKNDANDTTTGIITAGGLTLSEAASVSIGTPLLASTDHTYSGMSAEMLAGGAIGAQDLVCIHTTTSEVVVADASAVGTARAIGIAPAAISDTATGTVLLQGFIRDDSWNWTTGGVLYNSETAGDLTQTAPTTDGAFVQVVGIALSPDVAYINPSLDIIEHA